MVVLVSADVKTCSDHRRKAKVTPDVKSRGRAEAWFSFRNLSESPHACPDGVQVRVSTQLVDI